MSNVINGLTFEKMMQNALNNLFVHEKEINDMNVFPVADGDTGTNMRLTLENGVNNITNEKHLGKYIKALAKGMLLGARGNSGVILSQLFKGMADELISKSIINPGEFRDSLIKGYKTAYKAVLNPVEGTILTVSRLGIENIKAEIRGSISFIDTFKLYLGELNKTLCLTPCLLSVLKDANVLDSGAKGYIVIVEGMYKYLLGQIVERDYLLTQEELESEEKKETVEGFHIEFELKKNDKFNIESLDEKLKELSVNYELILKDGIVDGKVNATNPTPILNEIKEHGEIISIKLDNNKFLSNEDDDKQIPFKAIAYIACVSGSGVKKLYKEFGVDILINPNPSTQDFLNSFKKVNAERIVIYPNDKNVIETANQAMKLSNLKNISIVPTKNVIEGYYSLAMDVPDSSVTNRLEAINECVGVKCINYSKAIKSYTANGKSVKIGDFVAYYNDQVLVGDIDLYKCIASSLKNQKDINSKNSAFILLGKNAPNDFEDKLNNLFNENYPQIEVTILDGGQDKEDVMIGLL